MGSSPYITPEGFAMLQAEEREIWRKRAEVTRALSAAAAEVDDQPAGHAGRVENRLGVGRCAVSAADSQQTQRRNQQGHRTSPGSSHDISLQRRNSSLTRDSTEP